MPRKIIQDIIVKKSIRMVKKNDAKESFFASDKKKFFEQKPSNDLINKIPVEENTNNLEYREIKKHVTKDSVIFLWVICIAAIATLLFILSSTFATATLTITPKNQNIILNDTYNITSDKNISSSTLHFEVMTITKNLSKTLKTDGEEYVERKGVGKAFLYNNFSTANQRLINNTRLETTDGLTYRIRQSVDVPGVKIINGVKTPGSIEVEIIADMPGDKYNMKLTDFKGDFTIPGFKGSTKYTAFYGRLSANVVGGFVGNVEKVSDAILNAGRDELKNTLNIDLIKEIFSTKPEQDILFKDNYYIQCNDLTDDYINKDYTISEECSINAIAFNKSALSSFIAVNKIKNFDNSKVDIIWNDNDTVSLQGTTEKPWNETSLKATFTGPAQIVWVFDTNGILSSIVGQNKSIISSIMENNKNSLTEIQATIRPTWRNTFPENVKKIKIVDTIRDNIK